MNIDKDEVYVQWGDSYYRVGEIETPKQLEQALEAIGFVLTEKATDVR